MEDSLEQLTKDIRHKVTPNKKSKLLNRIIYSFVTLSSRYKFIFFYEKVGIAPR